MNSGLNWNAKTDFEISLSSGALAIDELNPDIIYYGTGEATYFTYSYSGRGLLKSTDGGNSWVNYTSGLPTFTYFSRLVIKPGNSNILFAALGNAGLYKSSDSGQNWSLVLSVRCDDIVFFPDGSKAYIIGQGTGYRISTDGGIIFTQYNVFTLGTRNHIAICKTAPDILYTSVYNGSSTVCVYKSTNSGFNYTLLQDSFTGANQAWYDFYIYVNPFDQNYAYVGLIDLWRTTDGNTFSKITNGSASPVHVDHHNMDFHPTDPDKLICANDGGVWYSTNRGTNWTNLNSTLTLTQFYRVTSDPLNGSHLIGGTQDNGVQRTTGAASWNVLIFGGDGGDVCFHSQNNNYIITENQFNRIRRSVDGGLYWSADTTGLYGSAAWIAPIISHPDSAGIFYTARQKVFKSNNYGATWFAYSSGTNGAIREMAISKTEPNVIFVSTNFYIYKSTNGGLTFSNITNGLPSRFITSINVHPDSSNVILVSLSGFGAGHIFKSTNGGNSWIDISGNLPDAPANDVMFYYPNYSTSVLITATDLGVYITNDYGNFWSELANGLPNTVAIHLDYNKLQSKLRVATHGRGVWEYNGSITGIVNRYCQTPARFNLFQNYPNPFNLNTKFEFEIAKVSDVMIKVFDVLGREITKLVNEQLKAGTYQVDWDASNYPSGLYFYKLIAGDFVDVKKMILVK